MKKLLTSILLLTFAAAFTACDSQHRDEVQANWQIEYDDTVEAIRTGETPPTRGLLSFGQQDEAFAEGHRLAALDEEKGTPMPYTIVNYYCSSCRYSPGRYDILRDGDCPNCGGPTQVTKIKTEMKRYDGN